MHQSNAQISICIVTANVGVPSVPTEVVIFCWVPSVSKILTNAILVYVPVYINMTLIYLGICQVDSYMGHAD